MHSRKNFSSFYYQTSIPMGRTNLPTKDILLDLSSKDILLDLSSKDILLDIPTKNILLDISSIPFHWKMVNLHFKQVDFSYQLPNETNIPNNWRHISFYYQIHQLVYQVN